MEEALRKSESKFREIFNSINEGILILDDDGQFIEVNDVACELLGYSWEDLLKMGSVDLDAPEFATNVSRRMEEIRTAGTLVFESVRTARTVGRRPYRSVPGACHTREDRRSWPLSETLLRIATAQDDRQHVLNKHPEIT